MGSFNLRACKYFDKLNEIMDWDLVHGGNGGEFIIKINNNTYKLDAYDEFRKIIVEYDERAHRNYKNKNSDLIRQKNIIQYFKPSSFWRYSEFDQKLICVYKGFNLGLNFQI